MRALTRVSSQAVTEDGDFVEMLREEVVAMTNRCELYFTLGLRFLFLCIAQARALHTDTGVCACVEHSPRSHSARPFLVCTQVFWCLGTTALLVSNCVVLLLLLLSDEIVVNRHAGKSDGSRRGVRAAKQGSSGGGSGNGSNREQRGEGEGSQAWIAPGRTASTAFADASAPPPRPQQAATSPLRDSVCLRVPACAASASASCSVCPAV